MTSSMRDTVEDLNNLRKKLAETDVTGAEDKAKNANTSAVDNDVHIKNIIAYDLTQETNKITTLFPKTKTLIDDILNSQKTNTDNIIKNLQITEDQIKNEKDLIKKIEAYYKDISNAILKYQQQYDAIINKSNEIEQIIKNIKTEPIDEIIKTCDEECEPISLKIANIANDIKKSDDFTDIEKEITRQFNDLEDKITKIEAYLALKPKIRNAFEALKKKRPLVKPQDDEEYNVMNKKNKM